MNTDPLGRAQPLSIDDATTAVDAAMRGRRSIRAFLPDPVPRAVIEAMLDAAARAPSGTNTQPWKVYVVTGAARQRLVDEVSAAYDDPAERARHTEPYDYYPQQWISPYVDRRRKVGWDLYALLGIHKTRPPPGPPFDRLRTGQANAGEPPRGAASEASVGALDKAGMHAQHRRNFAFFDAPVGLLFTLPRVMAQGSWVDVGMFIQNVMLAARARGLDTCPQAAWTTFHRIVMRHVGAGGDQIFVCGMALGHADPRAIENTLVTEREPVAGFATFVD